MSEDLKPHFSNLFWIRNTHSVGVKIEMDRFEKAFFFPYLSHLLTKFQPKLVCFSGSTIWRTFVNSFAPELDVNDVFYGLQNISHPMLGEIYSNLIFANFKFLEEKLRSFFYVLPSQLQASQAATLFAEIRIIKG